ncbi:MAG: PilZ domain-containing protein [Methylococcales symbiont of Hymedesmia sp. n. MRB-2018]|nr:MAG: PilZ domain-containing protein [Methylococcales symbiont of Hymedesmia sp. n. MRB-2018]
MSDEKRSYRKNLTSYGLIYIGGEELEISVRNLSITGVLAELENNSSINNINAVFASIKESSLIDIYLPEMRLAGEAEVVRADMVDGHIYLAIEFRTVSYDIDNVLYKRKVYRKEMTAPGQIIFNGNKYKFFSKNVSVDGLMILLNEYIEVDNGTITIFDFKRLQLRGKIKVAWVERADSHSTLMGLQYVQMKKEDITGIPRFSNKTEQFTGP